MALIDSHVSLLILLGKSLASCARGGYLGHNRADRVRVLESRGCRAGAGLGIRAGRVLHAEFVQ